MVAALDVATGTYNVVEDDPLTNAEHARVLGGLVGRRVRRLPRHVAVGPLSLQARSLRVSNRRLREATAWRPAFSASRGLGARGRPAGTGTVRQAASRARTHLAQRRPRYEHSAQQREEVARAFVDAVAGADLDGLMAVLAPDVTFVADGGGVVAATRHPLHGAERVGQVLLQLARLRPPDVTFALREVNGETGIVVRRDDDAPDSVWVLHVAGGRVAGIDVVRNPDKLRAFGP